MALVGSPRKRMTGRHKNQPGCLGECRAITDCRYLIATSKAFLLPLAPVANSRTSQSEVGTRTNSDSGILNWWGKAKVPREWQSSAMFSFLGALRWGAGDERVLAPAADADREGLAVAVLLLGVPERPSRKLSK